MIVRFDFESKLRLYEVLRSICTTKAVGTLPRFRRCLGTINFELLSDVIIKNLPGQLWVPPCA